MFHRALNSRYFTDILTILNKPICTLTLVTVYIILYLHICSPEMAAAWMNLGIVQVQLKKYEVS